MKLKIHELRKKNKKVVSKTHCLKTALLVATTILFFSCSKDDEAPTVTAKVFPEENPIPSFLNTSGFNQTVSSNLSTVGDYTSYGFAFKPKVNGTINSIVIKLPRSDGGVVVRIWKVATQELLRTIPIVVATNNLEVTTPIEKLALIDDEEYVITMRVDSQFVRRRTDNADVNLPITVNNIKITGVTSSNSNNYPGVGDPSPYLFFGELSFNFQQTE